MAFGNDHKPLNGLEQFQKHFDFKPFILNKNKIKNIATDFHRKNRIHLLLD